METGVGGWGAVLGRWQGRDGLQGWANPYRPLRFCKMCSLLLAGWPEKPRVDSGITDNLSPQPATIYTEVEEVWQHSHGHLASLGTTQTRTLGSPDSP